MLTANDAFILNFNDRAHQALGVFDIHDQAAIEEIQPMLATAAQETEARLFAHVSDADLARLGIDPDLLMIARFMTSEAHLDAMQKMLPDSQYQALADLAAGYTPEEVWAEISQDKPAEPVDIGDIVKAMERTPIRPCFARIQTWLQAGKYMNALASGLPAVNGWTVAEERGDRSPDAAQRLLYRAAWDETAVMGQVRTRAAAGLDQAAARSRRWPAEGTFEFAKDYFGLDQCQARLHTSVRRHLVLVMAALAVCAVTAAQLRKRTDTQAPPPASADAAPPADPRLVPLSVREVCRLLGAALARPKPPGHAARWLEWRRRHQPRSRWFHKRARLAHNYALVS